uniref:Uncharacterized protein n=1 Tax=Zea mays TaxID=4577 RepID=C4J401_MAIZE|nr:unknown [Zea mays]ACR36576.1 unknown [Zea mays]
MSAHLSCYAYCILISFRIFEVLCLLDILFLFFPQPKKKKKKLSLKQVADDHLCFSFYCLFSSLWKQPATVWI